MVKKGISSLSSVVLVISGLIMLFVIIFLVKNIVDTSEGAVDDNKCKQSVREYAALKMGSMDVSDFEINCPTRNFDSEHLGALKGSEEELKKQVADEMYRCWSNYGEGKLKLFSAPSKLFFEDNRKFCAECAYITFEDPDLKLDHFVEYLIKNEIPGGGKTYYEFFSDFQTTPDVIDKASQETQDTLYTNQEYKILYTHYNQGYYNKYKELIKASTLIGVATVGEGALVLSAATAASVTAAGPIIIAAGAAIAVVGLATYAVSAVTGAQDWHASVEIVNNNALESLKCKNLPIRTEE